MHGIVEFLRARYDEETTELASGDWTNYGGYDTGLITAHVEAMRRIVDMCDGMKGNEGDFETANLVDNTLEALAAVYADHELYREEWRDTPRHPLA